MRGQHDRREGLIRPKQLQHIGGRNDLLHQLPEVWRRDLHGRVRVRQFGLSGGNGLVQIGRRAAADLRIALPVKLRQGIGGILAPADGGGHFRIARPGLKACGGLIDLAAGNGILRQFGGFEHFRKQGLPAALAPLCFRGEGVQARLQQRRIGARPQRPQQGRTDAAMGDRQRRIPRSGGHPGLQQRRLRHRSRAGQHLAEVPASGRQANTGRHRIPAGIVHRCACTDQPCGHQRDIHLIGLGQSTSGCNDGLSLGAAAQAAQHDRLIPVDLDQPDQRRFGGGIGEQILAGYIDRLADAGLDSGMQAFPRHMRGIGGVRRGQGGQCLVSLLLVQRMQRPIVMQARDRHGIAGARRQAVGLLEQNVGLGEALLIG